MEEEKKALNDNELEQVSGGEQDYSLRCRFQPGDQCTRQRLYNTGCMLNGEICVFYEMEYYHSRDNDVGGGKGHNIPIDPM